MFIPYGTDAPIYYWPKATVGLIIANVLIFFGTQSLDEDRLAELLLVRGDGLHPVQWVTSFFMHANLEHLIGNMIFLWAFGIIVEGKLGVLKFLPLYLIIGTIHSACMQLISLRSDHGYILGASAAIYGLMAICLVWAPANELNCLWFWRFVPHQVDISILWFAILYIGMEFAIVALTHAQMRTEFLHLTGAMVGFVFGAGMVKLNLVDCENWDLFAVMAGRKGESATKAASRKARTATTYPRPAENGAAATHKRKARSSAEPESEPGDAATRKLRRLLESGDPLAAHAAYDKAMRSVPGWQPDPSDWTRLIKGLLDANQWRPAVNVMEDYLRRVPEASPRVRIKLAQILIRNAERPGHALRVLEPLSGAANNPEVEKFRRSLVAEATHMQEEGVLELDGDAW